MDPGYTMCFFPAVGVVKATVNKKSIDSGS